MSLGPFCNPSCSLFPRPRLLLDLRFCLPPRTAAGEGRRLARVAVGQKEISHRFASRDARVTTTTIMMTATASTTTAATPAALTTTTTYHANDHHDYHAHDDHDDHHQGHHHEPASPRPPPPRPPQPPRRPQPPTPSESTSRCFVIQHGALSNSICCDRCQPVQLLPSVVRQHSGLSASDLFGFRKSGGSPHSLRCKLFKYGN